MEITKVAVIGGGTMGNGICHVFAMNGMTVHLVETSQELAEKAVGTIEKNLARMVKKDKVSAVDKVRALQCIDTYTGIAVAVRDTDLVVEAVPESFEIKKQVFSEVDKAAPDRAILASNTSSISITKLATTTSRPERFIGMHFFNPVPIMKLVEVVKGYGTEVESVDNGNETPEQLGKTPVALADYTGFVANSVIMPMINETNYCVHEGVAEPEDADSVMKLGMAHPMCPLRLVDFIGLDVF